MINNLFIFALALFMVIRGATLATDYAARLADNYRLSRYATGLIIIAIISILPETFIAVSAALKGVPEFGLGMLFGSNIADLTLIFAIIIWVAGRSLKIEGKIVRNHVVYPFILLVPLALGFNGHFSRMEGVALILAGCVFYYLAFKKGTTGAFSLKSGKAEYKNLLMLILSMAILLIGAHFTVVSATSLAELFGISPILIGMLIVGLGTTMPELFFSLKAVKKNDDSLAVGDLLGTVLADATIVVGIIALVNPFEFPQKIIYITGLFMVAASILLFKFMQSGRTLSRREAWLLFAFWLLFVFVEFIANT